MTTADSRREEVAGAAGGTSIHGAGHTKKYTHPSPTDATDALSPCHQKWVTVTVGNIGR